MKEKGSELSIYSSPKRRRLDLFFFFFLLRITYRLKFSYRPKLAGMAETGRNTPKSGPRWNGGVSGTGLHADTKNSVRFGRNGTELITMIYIYIYIYISMGSSYTWCNSYKLTPFLHRRFLKDLTVKKTSLNAIVFHLTT